MEEEKEVILSSEEWAYFTTPIHPETRRFKNILSRGRIYNFRQQNKPGRYNWVLFNERYTKHGHDISEFARFVHFDFAKRTLDDLRKTADKAKEDFGIMSIKEWREL